MSWGRRRKRRRRKRLRCVLLKYYVWGLLCLRVKVQELVRKQWVMGIMCLSLNKRTYTLTRHSPFTPWGLVSPVAFFFPLRNKQKAVKMNLEKRQLLSPRVRPGYEHRQGGKQSKEEEEERVLTQSLSLRDLSSDLWCRPGENSRWTLQGYYGILWRERGTGSIHKKNTCK